MSALINDGGSDDGIRGSTSTHEKNGVVGLNNDTTARNASTPEGNGVMGYTQVPDGAGVFGLHNSSGVGVAGFGHPSGIGVVGTSAPPGAKGGDGVLGVTNSEMRNGIVGVNDSTTAKTADGAGGNGIFGLTQVPNGSGVFGANASTGIGVSGLGLIGVSGGSINGVGVVGVSAPPSAKGGDGVQGITNNELRNGVSGFNMSTTARSDDSPAGNGVFGFSEVPNGAGILGSHSGNGFGVVGAAFHGVSGNGTFGVVGTGTAIALWGIAKDNGWAGYFSGNVGIEGKLTNAHGPIQLGNDVDVSGTITVTGGGDVILADCAEEFEVVAMPCKIDPGSVMVLEETGLIRPCNKPYDSRVVGVVSGAGPYRPAITLDRANASGNCAPVSLLGKVCCKVDATSAPIETGDLLTTSSTEGHAMKAGDPFRAFGAVIGKALEPLKEGRGLVTILVTLQ